MVIWTLASIAKLCETAPLFGVVLRLYRGNMNNAGERRWLGNEGLCHAARGALMNGSSNILQLTGRHRRAISAWRYCRWKQYLREEQQKAEEATARGC